MKAGDLSSVLSLANLHLALTVKGTIGRQHNTIKGQLIMETVLAYA